MSLKMAAGSVGVAPMVSLDNISPGQVIYYDVSQYVTTLTFGPSLGHFIISALVEDAGKVGALMALEVKVKRSSEKK